MYEIISRNSVSLLNFATNDIYTCSEGHSMKLNPTKSKEMLINFMNNHTFIVNPIVIGGNSIERVLSPCGKIYQIF